MRLRNAALLVGFSVVASAPLSAQAQPSWVEQLLEAARLPVEAASARREGVASEEIRSVLEAMRTARVPAHEAVTVMDTARAARAEHGPVDNFGAFVQSQLASGKRGRELAAAIRAEHGRSGKGASSGGAGARGRGNADTGAAGKAGGNSSGKAAGKAPGRGRSDSAGAAGQQKGNDGRGRPARPNP